MADRLTDDNDEARLQAAAGLALLGDPRGLEAFRAVAGTVAAGTEGWWRVDTVNRLLAEQAEAHSAARSK